MHNGSTNVWDDFTKFMPWLSDGETAQSVGVTNTSEWLEELNQFARTSVKAWKQNFDGSTSGNSSASLWCTKGGYYHNSAKCAWGAFMQYGMGWTSDGNQNPTIVYNRWSNNGMPFRFMPPVGTDKGDGDQEENALYVEMVREFFQQSPGLRVVCTGHQPQGDMANSICVEVDNNEISADHHQQLAWIVPADTSYSGDVRFWDKEKRTNTSLGREDSKSGRGMRAVCEVILSWVNENGKDGRSISSGGSERTTGRGNPNVYYHGTLSDGTTYETLPLSMTTRCAKEVSFHVGKIDQSGLGPSSEDSPQNGPWWTRAMLHDGTTILCAGHEFKFWNCKVPSLQH
mmetsp:Transcript_20005/g.41805  ORF Transcript_20005/g.41805 Transcript_20005/m.41805 type:complete len:343 (-) Transcript_20005:345-1373(-)